MLQLGEHKAVAKLLLEKGAELETKDRHCDRTPLLWAATRLIEHIETAAFVSLYNYSCIFESVDYS